jgi:eukaryotic-like serine/threonine-protein kinase
MAPLDARSDVFSLGSVLFELAVGEAPFGDDHTPGTLDALRTCDADRLAVKLVDANVPSWLTQVVLTCLRRDPDDRYASAASLADALDEAMRRAGVVQTAARQSLARRVQAIHHQVDPVQPAEPLPPLISSDPTGSHRALGRGRLSALPGWARGLAMATAGALVGLTSLFAIDALRSSKSSATASDQSWIPSLAADANLDDAATTPVPRLVEPAPELDDASARERRRAPLPSADEHEPTPEVPRKRKASTPRKQDDSGEFKGNPYD